jgi:hypothetical protein
MSLESNVIFDVCNLIASAMVASNIYVRLSMNETELLSFKKNKTKQKQQQQHPQIKSYYSTKIANKPLHT